MTKHLPENVYRGLTMRQAAAYCGVCYNTFRKPVELGAVPKPMSIPGLGRHMFDRKALDAAIDACSGAA